MFISELVLFVSFCSAAAVRNNSTLQIMALVVGSKNNAFLLFRLFVGTILQPLKMVSSPKEHVANFTKWKMKDKRHVSHREI